MERHILIVDDDSIVVELLETVLEQQGYRITTAPDGETALDMLQQDVRPDIILLDHLMPGMDGPQVLAELRRNQRTALIPVVMLTARTNDEDIKLTRDLGAADHVAKPINVPALFACLVKILDRPPLES